MATWEDGPEYAPLERPADFTLPEGASLDVAPPVEQLAALAPKDRPVFAGPEAPLAPLAALVPDVKEPRDPSLPFEVAATAVTSDSAWGALQHSAPLTLQATAPPETSSIGAVIGAAPPGTSLPPPPAAPWPAPEAPYGPGRVAGPGPVSGFPAPGTPDWFGPGPYAPPPAPTSITLKQVLTAATPGLCICLVVGGLIYVLSPILLAVALGLSSRVTVAAAEVRRAFHFALGAVGLIAVIAASGNQTGFAGWWDVVAKWSLFFCWVMLVVTGVLVYRGLKQPPGNAPRRVTWG